MIIGFRRLDAHEATIYHVWLWPNGGPPLRRATARAWRLRRANEPKRAIAVHALEHLATTDRGVIDDAEQHSAGHPVSQKGEDPEHVVWEEGRVVPMFANQTATSPPPRSDARSRRAVHSGDRTEACGRLPTTRLSWSIAPPRCRSVTVGRGGLMHLPDPLNRAVP